MPLHPVLGIDELDTAGEPFRVSELDVSERPPNGRWCTASDNQCAIVLRGRGIYPTRWIQLPHRDQDRLRALSDGA